MKHFFILISSIFLFISCNKNDDEPTNSSNFIIATELSTSVINVDEPFQILIQGNEPIKELKWSTNNFSTSIAQYPNSVSKILYFNFPTVGEKTISLKLTNSNNYSVEKNITINVVRGSALKITGIKVLSFHNINQTWDSEYQVTDINRLADVGFALAKQTVFNNYDNIYGIKNFYTSAVKTNQGDLNWQLSDQNIYIKADRELFLALFDDDGNGISQDLLMGPPDAISIDLASYLTTKPSIIYYNDTNKNLSLEVHLEWVP